MTLFRFPLPSGDRLIARLARRRGPAAARLTVLALMLMVAALDSRTGVNVSFTVFYLLPVALATTWLGARDGVVTALASIGLRQVGNVIALEGASPPTWDWWNAGVALATSLTTVWLVQGFIGLHRDLERRVAERTEALQQAVAERRTLERALLEVSARERKAIGHELHDDLCQHLLATAFAARVVAEQPAGNPIETGRTMNRVVSLLEAGIGKARRLARGLLLATIDPPRLSEELAELAASGHQGGVRCRFEVEGSIALTDPTVAAQLFRIAQEAFRNALHHAGAREVAIHLRHSPGQLELTIDDDGQGLPAVPREEGMGLRIMAHRAAYIGGTLELGPRPDRGTRVSLRLPIT